RLARYARRGGAPLIRGEGRLEYLEPLEERRDILQRETELLQPRGVEMQLVVCRIVVVVDELALGIALLVQLCDHLIEVNTPARRRLDGLSVIGGDGDDAPSGP